MFVPRPIGFVSSPYHDTNKFPRVCTRNMKQRASLKLLPEFEPGLIDIEGFSHLFVLWEFDRSRRLRSGRHAALRRSPARSLCHSISAPPQPYRSHGRGVDLSETLQLHVRGVDMLDGTPILDIKPYLSSVPAETLTPGLVGRSRVTARQLGRAPGE